MTGIARNARAEKRRGALRPSVRFREPAVGERVSSAPRVPPEKQKGAVRPFVGVVAPRMFCVLRHSLWPSRKTRRQAARQESVKKYGKILTRRRRRRLMS